MTPSRYWTDNICENLKDFRSRDGSRRNHDPGSFCQPNLRFARTLGARGFVTSVSASPCGGWRQSGLFPNTGACAAPVSSRVETSRQTIYLGETAHCATICAASRYAISPKTRDQQPREAADSISIDRFHQCGRVALAGNVRGREQGIQMCAFASRKRDVSRAHVFFQESHMLGAGDRRDSFSLRE